MPRPVVAGVGSLLPGVGSNAADPGYTATDLNGHSGYQTVTEGTDAIVRPGDAATGRADRWLLRSRRTGAVVRRRHRGSREPERTDYGRLGREVEVRYPAATVPDAWRGGRSASVSGRRR
ncbi:hypothetical protein [Nocardia niwae]|uniref:Uncharacterized protein n=1 Tax=Nocardia niwae TaxID=626084 RepID=A0ABV2XJZ9_9NOCA